jgi:hypothetical protein
MTLTLRLDKYCIKLSSSAETLRKLICKAQRDKKEDPSSRGGNSTKKILISANLSDYTIFSATP